MEKIIILFQHNDEYGHWDIRGVFSSEEELLKARDILVENSNNRNEVEGWGFKFTSDFLLNWDNALASAKEKYGENICLGGDGYYWKWININELFGHLVGEFGEII